MAPLIRVDTGDFSLAREYESLRTRAGDAGAVASFIGLVRELYDSDDAESVQVLELEHYPGMAEKALEEIALTACERWPISACTIIHRVGKLLPGEQIVLVMAASAHRQAAFDAAQFLMDYLKSDAPFWKRQTSAKGSSWISSRDSDKQAKLRWQEQDS